MRFKNILLIDNFDSFTFNLVDFFRLQNCKIEIFRNDIALEKINSKKFDLIVFSPGPSIPKMAGNMMKIIKKFHQKIPMFGVCLGHEALIEFFGGSLRFTLPVHGKSSPINHDGKTIFSGIAQDFPAGRYHSLSGDEIPDCFEISAEFKDIVMAIRHKNLPIEAVQFHPESVLTMQNNNGLKIIKNIVEGNFANIKNF